MVPRIGYVIRCYILAALLNFGRDYKQRFQFVLDISMLEIGFDLLNQIFIAIQVGGCNCTMAGLAVKTIVEIRNVGGDQFALSGSKRMRTAEKNLYDLIEWLCCFRAKGHGSANSGQSFRQCDIGHSELNLSK